MSKVSDILLGTPPPPYLISKNKTDELMNFFICFLKHNLFLELISQLVGRDVTQPVERVPLGKILVNFCPKPFGYESYLRGRLITT